MVRRMTENEMRENERNSWLGTPFEQSEFMTSVDILLSKVTKEV